MFRCPRFIDFLQDSGGFRPIPLKLQRFSNFLMEITELHNLVIEITEVSVMFTDGWQHCKVYAVLSTNRREYTGG